MINAIKFLINFFFIYFKVSTSDISEENDQICTSTENSKFSVGAILDCT
jgi:hypothetical protein